MNNAVRALKEERAEITKRIREGERELRAIDAALAVLDRSRNGSSGVVRSRPSEERMKKAVAVLPDLPKPFRTNDLAAAIGSGNGGAISGLVRALVESGRVERLSPPDRKRRVEYRVTEEVRVRPGEGVVG